MNDIEVRPIHGRPPNWDAICAVVTPPPTAVLTYAPHTYVLSGRALTPDLIAHEAMHLWQQRDDAAGWWERWLSDIAFRREQELACYFAQMSILRRMVGDRNELARIRREIASDLAGPMYGRVLDFNAAYRALGVR